MVKTKEVKFNYDNQIFFKFQDIDLKMNENLLIIGSSGIGKTTLLHLLAGLLKSSSGSIKLFGKELNELSSYQLDRFRKNNIGIIFMVIVNMVILYYTWDPIYALWFINLNFN